MKYEMIFEEHVKEVYYLDKEVHKGKKAIFKNFI